MQLRALAFCVLACVTAACSAVPIEFPAPGSGAGQDAPASGVSGGVSYEVVSLTNQERERNGLPALRANSRLMEAALIHANQMAAAQRSEHVIAGARYPTLETRLQAVDYPFLNAAENIAWNQRSAQEVVATWMGSSGHRRNILDPQLTEMGAAMARSARGEPYWIQVFGRPR